MIFYKLFIASFKSNLFTTTTKTASYNIFINVLAFFILGTLNINDFKNVITLNGLIDTSASFGFGSVSCIEKVCGEYKSENSVYGRGIFEFDYEKDASKLNDSLLCVYKFVAKKNEKVVLKFESFDVKSLAPDCIHEYVDVYIEADDQTLNNYVETNFLSRWCGWKKPSTLVSYHNVIVFAYHTDGTNRGSSFTGTYEFVDAKPYNLGRKTPNKCEYEFRSSSIESGMFMSPTYPGTYPNILNCTYKFIGQPNERVSIYFEEILLHFGADHCPYDVLKIYDYQKNVNDRITNNYESEKKSTASKQSISIKSIQQQQQPDYQKQLLTSTQFEKVLIDSYCGRKLNFTLFSTYNQFEIEFEMFDSLGNEEYSEDESKIMLRKGFKAFFKFSKHYADLSFVTGTHITGTNCDQRISSGAETTGMIYSPNFFRSFPINASCKYIFEGQNDNYNFESIKLNFYLIDLKQISSKNICNDNSVSHFVVYGAEKHKPKFCFNRLNKEPKEIRSAGSEMTLIFNSLNVDQYTPSNFKASYTFFTEFGIEGTRVYPNRTCLYTYNSDNFIYGSVNSPRYPQNYPLNLRCNYLFEMSSRNERIIFTFKDFRLPGVAKNCKNNEDHLKIYQSIDEFENSDTSPLNVYKVRKRNNKNWSLFYRLCGNSLPLPFITDENSRKVKLSFYSDNYNYAQGFNLNYNYIRVPECKYNIFTNENVSSGQIVISKEISSYYCDWYIKTEPGKSVLLTFRNENLEDNRLNQFVVRVFDLNENFLQFPSDNSKIADDENDEKIFNQAVHEYVLQKSNVYYQVDSSYIKIQLVVEKTLVDMMNEGKLIINWITARKNIACDKDEFLCTHSNYCIKNVHYCNRVEDCPHDSSDEPEKCFIHTKQSSMLPPIMQITSFIISVLVLIIFLTICIICRIKSARRKKIAGNKLNGNNLNGDTKAHFNGNGAPVYYKYSPANSVDYLEAAITSV